MGLWVVSWVGMLVMLMGAVTIMVLGTLVTLVMRLGPGLSVGKVSLGSRLVLSF